MKCRNKVSFFKEVSLLGVFCIIIFVCIGITIYLSKNTVDYAANGVLEYERRSELQDIIIKVSSWDTEGCYGVVIDAYNHDIIEENDVIYVSFDNINVIYNKDGTEYEYNNIPNADYSSMFGKMVKVKFKTIIYKNVKNTIIYAEELWEY